MIIYKATNIIENLSYIGKTTKTIENRIYFHYKNKRKSYFGKMLQDYNRNCVEWIILYQCDNEKELNIKEKEYIIMYDTYNNGYNSTKGGDGGDIRTGMKNSKEHSNKISNSLIGHIVENDIKEKIKKKLEDDYYNGVNNRYKPIPTEIFEKIKIDFLIHKKSISSISKEYNICRKKIDRHFKYYNIYFKNPNL